MDDRELLELAAKAFNDPKLFANTTGGPWHYWIGFCEEMQCDVTRTWDPLTDDGDALRLAVKLGMKIRWHAVLNQALVWPCALDRLIEIQENGEDHGGDTYAAMRRAIVRAAAEIGRALP